MKPYSQRHLSEEKRIFNYRLSRGRRISENVFGILASRFRVFLTSLCVKPDSATKIVLAAIALHNFLRSKAPGRYIPPNSHKGRQPRKAEEFRDLLCNYFNGQGQIPWQWNILVWTWSKMTFNIVSYVILNWFFIYLRKPLTENIHPIWKSHSTPRIALH